MNPQIEDAAVVIGPLLLIGAWLKNACPNFPNRFIPLVSLALGTLGYLLKTGDWSGPNLFNALLVAVSVTGTHSTLKNLTAGGSDDSSSKPPASPRAPMFLLVVISALLFSGCAGPASARTYRTLEAISIAVEKAENYYGDRVAAGKVTERKQAEIDQRIIQFHAAFTVAVDGAALGGRQPADPALDRLATDLVNLIYALDP